MLASQVLSQTQGDRLKSDVPSPIRDEARRHNQLGFGFARQKNDREAIKEFREAIRLQPDYGEAHYNLGLALRQAGQPAESQSEMEKAYQLAPQLRNVSPNLE